MVFDPTCGEAVPASCTGNLWRAQKLGPPVWVIEQHHCHMKVKQPSTHITLPCLLPQSGYGDYQVSQWKGRRADAYATHLKEAMGRPNLSVVTGARATKLATESSSSGTRAVGVEYAVNGPSGTRASGGMATWGWHDLAGQVPVSVLVIMWPYSRWQADGARVVVGVLR